jgi:hypothetical protein
MKYIDRQFRLWEARVSHDQLLIRSPKDKAHEHNLDIRFSEVEYLELPTRFSGITVSSSEAADVARAEARLSKRVSPDRVFVLIERDRRFLVVAAGIVIQENDLDTFESSLEI